MPRHLIVDCTALESTIYPVTFFPAKAARWCCQTVSLTPLPHSPPSLFLNCLPSVIWSVTSPVILPCVLQVVAFCAETNLAGSLSPFPEKNQTLQWAAKSGRDWITDWSSFLGAFPDFPPPLRLPSCVHPFIHPCDIHPSVDHQWRPRTGIINLDYLKKRWCWGGPWCSGWRRFPRPRHSASDFTVKLDRASGARHHFLSHPQIHRSVTGMNADRCFPHAGTDVAVWASHTHTHTHTHTPWCLASLSREIQDWTQFCRHTSYSHVWIIKSLSSTDDIK